MHTLSNPEVLAWVQKELSQQDTLGTSAGWDVWVRASFVLNSPLPSLAIFNGSPPLYLERSFVFSWKTYSYLS